MYRNKVKKAKPTDAEKYGRRQPRPALRKQNTRKGAVLAAQREAGLR